MYHGELGCIFPVATLLNSEKVKHIAAVSFSFWIIPLFFIHRQFCSFVLVFFCSSGYSFRYLLIATVVLCGICSFNHAHWLFYAPVIFMNMIIKTKVAPKLNVNFVKM